MIHLREKDTNLPLGSITEEQLQFLIDQLEETSLDDQDYFIDTNTLAVLSDAGADAELIELLP